MTIIISSREVLKKLLEITKFHSEGNLVVGTKNEKLIPRSRNCPDPGRQIIILSDGESILATFAKQIQLEEFPQHKTAFTNRNWRKIVCTTFLDYLCNTKKEILKTAEEKSECIYTSIKDGIEQKIANFKGAQYVLGCHLNNHEMDPIIIGPVRFESRLSWLKRNNEESLLGSADVSYIKSKWVSNCHETEAEKGDTKAILDTIGETTWVCSVDILRPAGNDIGRNIALRAVSLALTAIALCFETPSTVLESILLAWDEKPNPLNILILGSKDRKYKKLPLQTFSPSSKGVQGFSKDNWGKMLKEQAETLHGAGRVISWYVEGCPNNPPHLPILSGFLYHSLIWFNMGCQEMATDIGTHHFMASLDAQSGGYRGKNIKPLLLNAGFPEKNADEIDNLYSVRCTISHGSYDQLGKVITDERGKAEKGALKSLRYSLDLFSQYDGEDDKELFSKEKKS